MTINWAKSVLSALQLIFALTLGALMPGVTSAAQAPAVIAWQLTDTKVVSWGKLGTATEGRMRAGIMIEARAVTETPDAIFPEGKFTVTMNAFSPFENMGDQKAGNWYLRGEWTITAKDADPAVAKARYNPSVLAGALSATLPYDPAEAVGAMEAEVRLNRGGGKPRTGRMPAGIFTGTTNLEGKLTTPFIASPTKVKNVRDVNNQELN